MMRSRLGQIQPILAELHWQMAAKLGASPVPLEPSSRNTLQEQADGLRLDADYLADLYRSLEVIVRHVTSHAATTGMLDVSGKASLPAETLEHEILSVMRAHADTLQYRAVLEASRRRPWFPKIYS
jgi:hypothetical protein